MMADGKERRHFHALLEEQMDGALPDGKSQKRSSKSIA